MGSLIKRLAIPAIVLLWSATYFLEVAEYSKKNQYLIKPVFIVMVILFAVNTFTDIREWKMERKKIKGHCKYRRKRNKFCSNHFS